MLARSTICPYLFSGAPSSIQARHFFPRCPEPVLQIVAYPHTVGKKFLPMGNMGSVCRKIEVPGGYTSLDTIVDV
jgi:hypothetical protein